MPGTETETPGDPPRRSTSVLRDEGESPPRWLVPASFAVALLFRLVGLGGSSMWLDEIMETLMARGTLRELFASLIFDRAQPPVGPLVTWVLLSFDAGELARRATAAAIGAAAVALFARWAARRLGPATAAVAALLLAASPVLLRYSHELRPYALSLLFTIWALDACDRWLERGAARFPFELAVVAGLASMTHYLAVALWLPVIAAWFEARSEGRAATLGWLLPAAAALALLPLAGWFTLLAARGGPRAEFAAASWDWELVGRRFDDLLFRGYAGQPVIEGSELLAALLVLVGLGALARRGKGLPIVAGIVAGTLVIEGVLRTMGRFSHVRYNQVGLVFLLTATAAGIVTCSRLMGVLSRRSGVATGALLTSAVLASFVTGDVGYAQHGRPDWPAVARAAVELEGPDATVIATSQWAQISLGYYLDRYRSLAEAPRDLPMAGGDPRRLREEIGRQKRECALVLEAGVPEADGLFAGLRPKRPILFLPDTDRARLYRFATAGAAHRSCFPPETFEVRSSPGYGSLLPWLAR